MFDVRTVWGVTQCNKKNLVGEKEVAEEGEEKWESAGPVLLSEAATAENAFKVPFKMVLVASFAEAFGLLTLSTFCSP